jgi:hypothetical protein
LKELETLQQKFKDVMLVVHLIKGEKSTPRLAELEDSPSAWTRFDSRLPAPGNEVGQYHDQRNNQQDMDDPSHRVTGYETQQPQNDQY